MITAVQKKYQVILLCLTLPSSLSVALYGPKINMPFKSHAAKYIVYIPLQTQTHMRTDEITFHLSIHSSAHIDYLSLPKS